MKQYTTPEQTAKLIELGFPKPENTQKNERPIVRGIGGPLIELGIAEYRCSYSIGELIEMLPKCIESGNGSDEAVLEISYDSEDFVWFCGHRWMYNRGWRLFNGDYRTCDDNELIDALYRYVVVLKEEGVI